MNRLSSILFIIAALLLSTGCTHEEEPVASLRVEVSDYGFYSPEATGTCGSGEETTRATSSGYTTTFAAGDAIGVFVLDSNGSTLLSNNLKVTRQSNGSWTPLIPYAPVGSTYYAYYPYNAIMNGKRSIQEIVSAFGNPDTNQSSPALFTAQDAMTATGVRSNNSIQFAFAHIRSLIEFVMPTGTTTLGFTGINPCSRGSNKWHYLITPGSSFSISGQYMCNSMSYTIMGNTITAPTVAGLYKVVTIKN